ncbi:MAG TPA: twin-arginine translocase TatA/TatE family subunit [Myxococcaceae bacterium]|nr:twin-arginine translocase TatA/TatE family subunit [Myxococcaceae bacterium]
MFGLRFPELLIILVALVLLFGAAKLPQLGSSIGQAIRNFKRGFAEASEDAPNGNDKKDLGTLASGGAPDAKAAAGKVGSRDA